MAEELLDVRIIVDKSLVEAYINEQKSLTTLVYPMLDDSKGISLFGDEGILVESIQVWPMNSIYEDR